MICPRRLLRRPLKYTVIGTGFTGIGLRTVFSAGTVFAKDPVRTAKAVAGPLQGGSTGMRLPAGFSCGWQDGGRSQNRGRALAHPSSSGT